MSNEIDEIGEFRRIPKEKLYVDKKYQRPLVGEPKLRKMMKTWNWTQCGTLTIGERPDGILSVIDGQQRLEVAMRSPEITLVPCMVYPSQGVEDEAKIFALCGTQKTRLSPHAIYNAAVVGNDEYAIELDRFVRSHGYEFGKNNTPRSIDCVRTIAGMYERDGRRHPEILRALELCMIVTGGKYAIRNDLFRGMACICGYGIVLDALAIEKLQKASKDEIDLAIRTQKAASGTDGGRSQAKGILKIANYQRTIHRIALPGKD